jgi:hypothetical protein
MRPCSDAMSGDIQGCHGALNFCYLTMEKCRLTVKKCDHTMKRCHGAVGLYHLTGRKWDLFGSLFRICSIKCNGGECAKHPPYTRVKHPPKKGCFTRCLVLGEVGYCEGETMIYHDVNFKG